MTETTLQRDLDASAIAPDTRGMNFYRTDQPLRDLLPAPGWDGPPVTEVRDAVGRVDQDRHVARRQHLGAAEQLTLPDPYPMHDQAFHRALHIDYL